MAAQKLETLEDYLDALFGGIIVGKKLLKKSLQKKNAKQDVAVNTAKSTWQEKKRGDRSLSPVSRVEKGPKCDKVLQCLWPKQNKEANSRGGKGKTRGTYG